MAYKLAVADVVEFDVIFNLREKGKLKPFKFVRVLGERIPQETLTDEIKNGGDRTITDFLLSHITGFESQNLLLDADTDAPVGYSPEALAAMLNVAGVPAVTYDAYLKALGAEGKKGN